MSKYLVGYDGSESAKVALDRAAAMMSDGDTLGVISVAPIVAGGPRSGGPFVAGDGPAEHRTALGEAVAILADRGIEPKTIEAIGDPGTAICEAAEQDGYTMIVVGSRNHTGPQRLLLGSVSDRVAHHADVRRADRQVAAPTPRPPERTRASGSGGVGLRRAKARGRCAG